MRRSDSVFLTFFQFGFDAALFQLRQVFDKHDAHQVVQFVLHADCQQAVCFQREFLAFFVQGFNFDALGTGDGIVNARHGQTAFFISRLTVFFDNDGIDEHARLAVVFG